MEKKLFKRLNETIEVVKIENQEPTAEELLEAEQKLVFGNLDLNAVTDLEEAAWLNSAEKN